MLDYVLSINVTYYTVILLPSSCSFSELSLEVGGTGGSGGNLGNWGSGFPFMCGFVFKASSVLALTAATDSKTESL